MSLDEQDELEERRFRSDWDAEQKRIYATLDKLDREVLIDAHSKIKDAPFFSHDFVDNIAWRVYTEWCMSPSEKGNPDLYDGQPFKDFVNDETHYAIERMGRYVSPDEANQVRNNVLGGLAKRAVDFFRDINPDWNLREDLSQYLSAD